MDPTRCLQTLLSDLSILSYAHSNQEKENIVDREDAIDGLRQLADWLERGGFPPRVGTTHSLLTFTLE
jgi:hypothetical protein